MFFATPQLDIRNQVNILYMLFLFKRPFKSGIFHLATSIWSYDSMLFPLKPKELQQIPLWKPNELPKASGNLTVRYWTWPVSSMIYIFKKVIFHSFLYVYQRVTPQQKSSSRGRFSHGPEMATGAGGPHWRFRQLLGRGREGTRARWTP